MNLFGIGLPELAVIAAIGLLVFGPKRLPELGKTLGRTLKGFQSASQEFEREFRNAIDSEPASAAGVTGGPDAVVAPLAPAADPVATLPAAAITPPAAVSAAGESHGDPDGAADAAAGRSAG